MTIASEITRIQNNISSAYTACTNKGVTLPSTQNSANLATCINSINAEVTLTRFKDDSNNVIGTWFCNFIDGNGTKYKVICLDAQYRKASGQWCSMRDTVTNLPLYANMYSACPYTAPETATTNTQLILNYCSAHNYTSSACTHCRSNSFTINNTVYYGQLPNLYEVTQIALNYATLNSMDTTASSYTSLNFGAARDIWSSTQTTYFNAWCLNKEGYIYYQQKMANYLTVPVLEIPA